MMIRRPGRQFLIFLSLVIWGCTTPPVETTRSRPVGVSKNNVLIATQKTKFKQAVVSEIRTALNNNSIYTKIIDVKSLRYQSSQNFSAVVIINRALAGRPDPRVEIYIDKEPQKNKIIVLTTGILDAWKPDTSGVDAMTSASVISESDKIAQKIVSKVLALVDQNQ
ncbi:MAG: hypothetical protein PVG06_02310 [Desulfobacterales bacterium]|jgi:hypothetical protein